MFCRFFARAMQGPAAGRIMFGSDHPVFADLIDHAGWIDLLFDEAEAEGGLEDAHWERLFSSNPAAFLRRPA